MSLPPEVVKLMTENATATHSAEVFAGRANYEAASIDGWIKDGNEIESIPRFRADQWYRNALAAAAIGFAEVERRLRIARVALLDTITAAGGHMTMSREHPLDIEERAADAAHRSAWLAYRAIRDINETPK